MSSWLYKLRRGRGGGEPHDVAKPPVAPAPSPCSPNRASYYVPSLERALPPPRHAMEDNPKLRDTHFPRSPQPSDDVVARHHDDRHRSFNPLPELKLRPILARHGAASADSSSAAASPTARVRPRFHHVRSPPSRRRRKTAALPTTAEAEQEDDDDESCCRRSNRRRRQRSASKLRPWMCESLVVVKESAEPEEDFLESMAEMIAANGGVRSPRGLEELLACYLALNVGSFLFVFLL